MRKLATIALLAIALAPPAWGQDRPPPAERPAADNPLAAPIGPAETRHALDLPGGRLGYRAVAESLPVTDRRGEVTGRVFTVSYLAEGSVEGGAEAGPGNGGARPVTFVFNGGPGAASAYLHLGGLGPRVLRTAPDGRLLPPPARLDDNPETWLAFTDLVFVDPVGTGFSRAAKAGEDAAKPFWGVGGDVRSLGEVLRLWLTRQGRWGAPVFLAGESYGGFRVARLARALSEGPGIGVAGVVMISPVVEFSTISPDRFDLLPWALSLPSMAASARALGRGEADTDPAAVERFALTEYLTGIAAIEPAGAGPSEEIVARVARLTGLDPELVRRHRARVPIHVFADRAPGAEGLAVSLYDGALAGPDPTPGRPGGPDILLDATIAPFSSAFNEHVGKALGVRTDVPFLLLDRRPSQEWDWEGSRSEAGALDELQEAMATVPGLSVLVVHGRTDLVTPYMASRWVLDRLDLPEEVRARVELSVLEGGHMMYFRHDMRAALTRTARDFYGRRLNGP